MRSLARRAPRCAPRRGDGRLASRATFKASNALRQCWFSAPCQPECNLEFSRVRSLRKKIPTTFLPRGDRRPRRRRARTHRQHRDGRHEPRWARGRFFAGGRRRLRAARGFGRCGDAEGASPVFPVFPRLPRGKPPPRRGRDARPLRGPTRVFAPITASADQGRARPATPRDAPHLRGWRPSASFSGRLAFARRDRPPRCGKKRVRLSGEGDCENDGVVVVPAVFPVPGRAAVPRAAAA